MTFFAHSQTTNKLVNEVANVKYRPLASLEKK